MKSKRIDLSAFISSQKEKFKKNKKLCVIVIVGVLGMILILLSELFDSSDKDVQSETVSDDYYSTSTAYKDKIQSELLSIIKKIDGVGEVDILVTVDGTTEYVYAEELDTQSNESDDSQSEDYNNKVVIIDEDGNQKPLIKKIVEPNVTGVLVVCSGGDRYEIIEKVYRAVSTALNIPTSSVCVVKG
ncbi:MAG: hypothetical protein LUC25_05805 [Ruminococcus sp.]|nr:hypothetical protein [Ruminococcus sp.]